MGAMDHGGVNDQIQKAKNDHQHAQGQLRFDQIQADFVTIFRRIVGQTSKWTRSRVGPRQPFAEMFAEEASVRFDDEHDVQPDEQTGEKQGEEILQCGVRRTISSSTTTN